MASGHLHGGSPGNSWYYDLESKQYVKTWRQEYRSSWEGEDGQRRPVIWSCIQVEQVTDPAGFAAFKDTWTWRWAELPAPARRGRRSRSPGGRPRKRSERPRPPARDPSTSSRSDGRGGDARGS